MNRQVLDCASFGRFRPTGQGQERQRTAALL